MQVRVKFKNRHINVKTFPTIIVGLNPGKQRIGSESGLAWEGNRSADFLLDCVKGIDNLILTNSFNYQEWSPSNEFEGLKDLTKLVNEYRPYLIVCLGNTAYDAAIMLNLHRGATVVKLPHPSYILRFNKDKETYKKELRGYLT